MKHRIVKLLVFVALFAVDIFLIICVFREPIISFSLFFAQSADNNYDSMAVNIISSIIVLILQGINLYVVNQLEFILKKPSIQFARWLYKCRNDKLSNAIKKMTEFLFSTTCKWGVSKNTEVLKIANTAEGLIACASISLYEEKKEETILSENQKDEIKMVADRLVQELTPSGYKSYNQETYTVHCTGMGLYAIRKLVDANLYQLTDETEEKIRNALKNLLATANDYGWGYENKQYTDSGYNRNFSTIWALKALNAWNFCDRKCFKKILRYLVENKNGIIGFAPDSIEKASVTAMLYDLVGELKNDKLKKELDKTLSDNIKNIVHFLVDSLKNEVEVEEFYLSIREAKKLPWTHLSECVVLEALAQEMDRLSLSESFRYAKCLRKAIDKIDVNQGYYLVRSMNFNTKDPFFFPTAYLLNALCKIASR